MRYAPYATSNWTYCLAQRTTRARVGQHLDDVRARVHLDGLVTGIVTRHVTLATVNARVLETITATAMESRATGPKVPYGYAGNDGRVSMNRFRVAEKLSSYKINNENERRRRDRPLLPPFGLDG